MKKMILAAFAIFSLSACSKSVSIKVDKILFDSAQEYIAVGDTLSLTAHVTPVYAANQEIAWSSSNEDVAKVEDGKVIAVSSGSAVITASASGGSIKADCNITIGDIYLCGYDSRVIELTSTFLSTSACWKNGKETVLSLVENADVYSSGPMAVSDGNMYVALKYYDRTLSSYKVSLWNGGNMLELESGSGSYVNSCKDIFMSGDSYYATGDIYYNETRRHAAAFWKDGKITCLTDGTLNAYGNSIWVSGSDVYIGGQIRISNSGVYVATIWKNGVLSNLTDNTFSGSVNDIYTSGSDVYAAGWTMEEGSSDYKATVWKNGVPSYIRTDDYDAEALSVSVSGDDLFVLCSYYDSNDDEKFEIWKNEVKLDLPARYCTKMCMFGDKMYVAGYGDSSYYKSYLFEIDTKSFKIIKAREYLGISIADVVVK